MSLMSTFVMHHEFVHTVPGLSLALTGPRSTICCMMYWDEVGWWSEFWSGSWSVLPMSVTLSRLRPMKCDFLHAEKYGFIISCTLISYSMYRTLFLWIIATCRETTLLTSQSLHRSACSLLTSIYNRGDHARKRCPSVAYFLHPCSEIDGMLSGTCCDRLRYWPVRSNEWKVFIRYYRLPRHRQARMEFPFWFQIRW